jgi:hemerythrin-like domain-containing protein
MPDALQLLRDDHRRVKELFRKFEETADSRMKGQIVEEALKELTIHAQLEDEIFYPAVRREAGVEGEEMDEADEEHHVAEMLIEELWNMRPNSSHYDAKFTVLAENVKHHIDEEESEILPKAAELGMGRMNELGAEMEERKMQLMKTGVRPMTKSRSSTRTTQRRSTAGATRRRTTAAGSTNGRTSRTTSRTTAGTRPRTTTSTRSRSGSSRAASSRSRAGTSPRKPAAASTSRPRATGSRGSTRTRSTSGAPSRGTSRARR